ncbi:hypothetical protein G7085_07150 [Tessaracoccus sp. HDW20]|uniref:hypothetical protein n=1 Tax=Tessaracoccus coleopterorum TaxID=2714950 RepID=UPI0018D2FA73|nr:hypothetical protein [Tessaracoccus coleopterorum]NHB84456.1 hypothetical protein [Tessaracoccus coleopterorum]
MRPANLDDIRLISRLASYLRVPPHLPGTTEFRAREALAAVGLTKAEDARPSTTTRSATRRTRVGCWPGCGPPSTPSGRRPRWSSSAAGWSTAPSAFRCRCGGSSRSSSSPPGHLPALRGYRRRSAPPVWHGRCRRRPGGGRRPSGLRFGRPGT